MCDCIHLLRRFFSLRCLLGRKCIQRLCFQFKKCSASTWPKVGEDERKQKYVSRYNSLLFYVLVAIFDIQVKAKPLRRGILEVNITETRATGCFGTSVPSTHLKATSTSTQALGSTDVKEVSRSSAPEQVENAVSKTSSRKRVQTLDINQNVRPKRMRSDAKCSVGSKTSNAKSVGTKSAIKTVVSKTSGVCCRMSQRVKCEGLLANKLHSTIQAGNVSPCTRRPQYGEDGCTAQVRRIVLVVQCLLYAKATLLFIF